MNKGRIIVGVVVLSAVLGLTASAATIEGRFSAYDAEVKELYVFVMDKASETGEERVFALSEDLKLEGVGALTEIDTGTPVRIEAEKDPETGIWRARAVKAGEAAAATGETGGTAS